jgi:uncharacterized protein
MRERWTVPIDQRGLVIYFGVQGCPFLFNGNKGTFYDSLPPRAIRVLNTLLDSEVEPPAAEGARSLKSGARRSGLWKEIQLYQSGTHPGLLPEPRQARFSNRLDPQEIVVYVSRACNLSCSYCFNQQGTFGTKGSLMSVETATKTVAFIRKILSTSTRPYVEVNLFGGEPLLARDALYVLVRGLQGLNRPGPRTRLHIRISTNGTIYDPRIFEILAEEPDCNTVLVTLDGFKEAQDKNRPFRDPSRGSSYDRVIANLRRMISEGVPYSVTCQVPYPYDYVAAAEELHRQGFEHLEIRRLLPHVFGRQDLPEVFRDDLDLWREKYLAYTDYFLDYLGGPHPSKHNDRAAIFGEYVRSLARAGDSPQTLACGVLEESMGIASDGRVLPCHCLFQGGLEIGHVSTGIDQAKFERCEAWLLSEGQLRIDNERCRNCYAKLLCGGGCYAESYDRAGRFEPLPEAQCQFRREKLKIDLYFISRMRKEHPELLKPAQ